MGSNKQYLKGILITLSGVIVLSADALLIRMSGAGGAQAAFWRALFTFLSLFTVLLVTKKRTWLTTLTGGGVAMLFSGLLWGISGISFSIGVHNSGAAVMLVMMGLSPFFAAAHSFIFYRTKAHPLTLLAAAGAVGGIFYMYNSQIGSIGPSDFLYTIWTPLFLGTNLSFLRQHAGLDRIAICTVGGLLGTNIAFVMAKAQIAVSLSELLPLVILGGLVIPFAQLSLSWGTKFIPAGESALISSLETIFGIFYVWVFLNEVPSSHTLIGAAIVFGCILLNTLIQAYWVKR